MRPKYSIQSSIQAGITRSQAGDTINVGPEATAESVVLNVPRNLAFNGSTIGSLALTAAAAGAGLRGAVTASGPAGFAFNAPVRLLGPTSLTAAAGNIAFNDDVQGSFDLSLRASGDISLVTGGSETLPLGMLTVSSNDFNLSSTLWVSGYNIDASGSVALSGHTLRALGSLDNVISAGSSVTGSTISAGNVQISGGNVSTSVISLGNVTVVAVTVDGALTGSFIVINAQDAVTASVSATQDVSVSAGGVVNLSGSATNLVITAPSATANGNFKKVTNNSGGAVTVNGAPQPSGSVPSVQQVLPAKVVTGADASGGGPLPALAVAAGDPGKSKRRQLKDAADVLQNGEALEIDLSPSND
jgi:hypothetical protein